MEVDIVNAVVVRQLGIQPYTPVWQQMKSFTDMRGEDTVDEIWMLQHKPVFTLGQSGKVEHLLRPGNTPVIKSDRGGQVTYHGPGQIVAYLMIDLRRRRLGVRCLISQVERAVIDLLVSFGIAAQLRDKAPGVYVEGKKIASLGLRVRNHCTFHGLSLNVAMDLTPFSQINVCGYEGLQVTQLSDLLIDVNEEKMSILLLECLKIRLGYAHYQVLPSDGSEGIQRDK